MCDKVVSKEHFLLKCCLDRLKTQEMCEKAVDACLPTLRFVPDWSVTNKMLKRLGSVLFFNYDIELDDIDSDIVTFFDDCMGLVMIELNNINFDDDIFDDDDPINIVSLDLFLTVKNLKSCKKI